MLGEENIKDFKTALQSGELIINYKLNYILDRNFGFNLL